MRALALKLILPTIIAGLVAVVLWESLAFAVRQIAVWA